jgi:hypothetical protein
MIETLLTDTKHLLFLVLDMHYNMVLLIADNRYWKMDTINYAVT